MLNVREKLSLMQQLEARTIRDASDSFGGKVEDFRKMFQSVAPVTVKVGRCRLTGAKPVLKAPKGSALETKMS
jgi:hypothetical protein